MKKQQVFLFMAMTMLILILVPHIAEAFYSAPAPDRLPGESFWHWLGRALDPDGIIF